MPRPADIRLGEHSALLDATAHIAPADEFKGVVEAAGELVLRTLATRHADGDEGGDEEEKHFAHTMVS
jgi:hypothetical protein